MLAIQEGKKKNVKSSTRPGTCSGVLSQRQLAIRFPCRGVKAGWLGDDLRQLLPPTPTPGCEWCWGGAGSRSPSLATSLASQRPHSKDEKRTPYKIMELPGKNILHDPLCRKYLFLSVCESDLSCLVPFSALKLKLKIYREKGHCSWSSLSLAHTHHISATFFLA